MGTHPRTDGMDTRAEIEAALALLAQAPQNESVKVLRGKMEARLAALREAPPGAGWEWLAARGDTGAMAVVRAMGRP